MKSFIIKDLLLFWRDRKEVIVVLLLPILLIFVLNFVFAELFGDEGEISLDLQLGIVNQDTNERVMDQLKHKLISNASLGVQEVEEIVKQMSEVQPASLLSNYLVSKELKDIVKVHELSEAEAVAKVEEEELDGILIIPKGFTVDSLYAAIAKEAPTRSIIYKVEKESNNNIAIRNIIEGYMNQLNYQFAVKEIAGISEVEVKYPLGGYEEIRTGNAFTMNDYFTIAMGALFALFLVATVATKTGVEIREQVFNRILLTNCPPIHYLIGKMVATFFLVFLQILFVVIVSHFTLDVFPDRTIFFWLGVILMIILVSLSLAGLAAIFTSISLRVTDSDAVSGIYMIVILLFGVLGGNFVPIELLPEWLQQMGEWTPNGIFLAMFTNWIQFEELTSICIHSIWLIGISLLFTLAGLVLFPERGKAG